MRWLGHSVSLSQVEQEPEPPAPGKPCPAGSGESLGWLPLAPFLLACLWVPGLKAGSGPSELPGTSSGWGSVPLLGRGAHFLQRGWGVRSLWLWPFPHPWAIGPVLSSTFPQSQSRLSAHKGDRVGPGQGGGQPPMLLTAPAPAPLHQPCETFSLHMTWNHTQPRAGRCRAPVFTWE